MIYYLANMYPVLHPMHVSTDFFLCDIMYDYYCGFHNALKIYAKIVFCIKQLNLRLQYKCNIYLYCRVWANLNGDGKFPTKPFRSIAEMHLSVMVIEINSKYKLIVLLLSNNLEFYLYPYLFEGVKACYANFSDLLIGFILITSHALIYYLFYTY